MSKFTLTAQQVSLVATRFLDYQLLDTRDEAGEYVSWNEIFTGEQIRTNDVERLRKEIESFIEENPVTTGVVSKNVESLAHSVQEMQHN